MIDYFLFLKLSLNINSLFKKKTFLNADFVVKNLILK